MNSVKSRSIGIDQSLVFSKLCHDLMKNMNCDAIMDHADIFVLNVLEQMTENKGINDPREYSEVAVQIIHALEAELRDYIEFTIDQEYGPSEDEKNGLD